MHWVRIAHSRPSSSILLESPPSLRQYEEYDRNTVAPLDDSTSLSPKIDPYRVIRMGLIIDIIIIICLLIHDS